MKDEQGNLSIDFLAGFTIFMIALITVATMVPGLLISLRSEIIDYDAVAYRTGVVLTEDPGMPAFPPWEQKTLPHKDEIIRMGLAIGRETPDILAPLKVEQFFSGGFQYPDDYQQKVIFGDHPYRFNISLRTLDSGSSFGLGDPFPAGYGYIRRGVMVKAGSNATVNANETKFQAALNSTPRVFRVDFNLTRLQSVQEPYRIDPLRERIILNITNISSTLYDAEIPATRFTQTTLSSVRVYVDGSYVPPDRPVYLDRASSPVPSGNVVNDISLALEPGFLSQIADADSDISVAFAFDDGTVPKTTTFTGNFVYDYNPVNVTQPRLNPGVMEVAVW
jgi:hypothetical protein